MNPGKYNDFSNDTEMFVFGDVKENNISEDERMQMERMRAKMAKMGGKDWEESVLDLAAEKLREAVETKEEVVCRSVNDGPWECETIRTYSSLPPGDLEYYRRFVCENFQRRSGS